MNEFGQTLNDGETEEVGLASFSINHTVCVFTCDLLRAAPALFLKRRPSVCLRTEDSRNASFETTNSTDWLLCAVDLGFWFVAGTSVSLTLCQNTQRSKMCGYDQLYDS